MPGDAAVVPFCPVRSARYNGTNWRWNCLIFARVPLPLIHSRMYLQAMSAVSRPRRWRRVRKVCAALAPIKIDRVKNGWKTKPFSWWNGLKAYVEPIGAGVRCVCNMPGGLSKQSPPLPGPMKYCQRQRQQHAKQQGISSNPSNSLYDVTPCAAYEMQPAICCSTSNGNKRESASLPSANPESWFSIADFDNKETTTTTTAILKYWYVPFWDYTLCRTWIEITFAQYVNVDRTTLRPAWRVPFGFFALTEYIGCYSVFVVPLWLRVHAQLPGPCHRIAARCAESSAPHTFPTPVRP